MQASIEFHEAGKKHKANVQAKLTEIGIKGRKDELKAKREEAWIEKMNQAAMKVRVFIRRSILFMSLRKTKFSVTLPFPWIRDKEAPGSLVALWH